MTMPAIVTRDDRTPPAAFFKCIQGRRHSFLLESALTDPAIGRYSLLGCDPFLTFTSKGDRIILEREDGTVERLRGDPFLVLQGLLKRYTGILGRGMPSSRPRIPFVSGCVGYFAYDLKDHIERLPDIAEDDLKLPDAFLGFYDSAIVYDHSAGQYHLASSGLPETAPGRRRERRDRRLAEMEDLFSGRHAAVHPRPAVPECFPSDLRSNFSFRAYVAAVERAKAYIARGDIYQVNLSQRFETARTLDPFLLYERLREASPAPFAAYLDCGGCTLVSSSPERFLMKRGGMLETRPIKGTRPRGIDARDDARLEAELVSSAKDRAEHVMIVDLERNDLGRVCAYGSVKPERFVALERYATVSHLVSTVSGRLRRGIDAVDCLRAAFPGGSITGAPKIRSMEIIEELEPVKRSVYTGAIGYISFDGAMDTSIVIRTFICRKNKVYFSVGGGIVADSDPEREYEETLDKGKALMTALGRIDVRARPRREGVLL